MKNKVLLAVAAIGLAAGAANSAKAGVSLDISIGSHYPRQAPVVVAPAPVYTPSERISYPVQATVGYPSAPVDQCAPPVVYSPPADQCATPVIVESPPVVVAAPPRVIVAPPYNHGRDWRHETHRVVYRHDDRHFNGRW